mgnify:CR=1 FL=1
MYAKGPLLECEKNAVAEWPITVLTVASVYLQTN